MDLKQNPYFYACPVSATSRATPDTVIIASSFVAKAKDGRLHLVMPAHFAADRADHLDDDFSSWFPEIRVRPAPDAFALSLPLFRGSRRLFLYRKGAFGPIDAISLPIPDAHMDQFARVNVVDVATARNDAVGSDVVFYGFPPIMEKWPLPFAIPCGGRIESTFLCHAQREVCPAYSGSAILAGNGDLVGMIVGAGERAAFIPADIIAAVVNDEPLPRPFPVFVEEGKVKIGAE